MSMGFQTWDASGNAIIGPTTSITRLVTLINTGTTSGSYTNSDLTGGNVFTIVIPQYSWDYYASNVLIPTVTYSSGTVTWTFPGGTYHPASCWIYVGLY